MLKYVARLFESWEVCDAAFTTAFQQNSIFMLKIWRAYCRSMRFLAHLLFILTYYGHQETNICFPPVALEAFFISTDYLGALPLPVLRESSVQREVWPLEPPAQSSFLHAAHEFRSPMCRVGRKGWKTRQTNTAIDHSANAAQRWWRRVTEAGAEDVQLHLEIYKQGLTQTHAHTHTRITPSPSQIRPVKPFLGVCLVDSHQLAGCSRACLHSQWGPEQRSTSQKIIFMSADCWTPVFAKGHKKDMKTIRTIYFVF